MEQKKNRFIIRTQTPHDFSIVIQYRLESIESVHDRAQNNINPTFRQTLCCIVKSPVDLSTKKRHI